MNLTALAAITADLQNSTAAHYANFPRPAEAIVNDTFYVYEVRPLSARAAKRGEGPKVILRTTTDTAFTAQREVNRLAIPGTYTYRAGGYYVAVTQNGEVATLRGKRIEVQA
jgi:hypothetical protein